MHILIFITFQILFTYSLLENIEYNSLCYTVDACWLFILYKIEQLHFHFSLFTFMHWRRKWQPTPVFLPGESQGWGNPVGCRLWGHTELDTTEAT